MLSAFAHAVDRYEDLAWGQILVAPIERGAWSLLDPFGSRGLRLDVCESQLVGI